MIAVMPASKTNQVRYWTICVILSASGGASGVGLPICASSVSVTAASIISQLTLCSGWAGTHTHRNRSPGVIAVIPVPGRDSGVPAVIARKTLSGKKLRRARHRLDDGGGVAMPRTLGEGADGEHHRGV